MLFDADRRIQIADVGPIRLETSAVEPFSGKGWAPTADVCAFASLLLEIAVDVSAFVSLLFEIAVGPATPPIGAADCHALPAAVSAFVPRMIKDGRSLRSNSAFWFVDIIARLKANRFEIMAGVDSDGVSAVVGSNR
jgi:hypothetical protein